jgi:CheY-like chemotaxis protein
MQHDENRNTLGVSPPPLFAGEDYSCRVFLVEDEVDDRIFSQRQLEACGRVNEVKCFADGEDLVRFMREEGFEERSAKCMTPTIIIVDLNMPRMDGYKVLEKLMTSSCPATSTMKPFAARLTCGPMAYSESR